MNASSKSYFLLAVLAICWGTSFILIKFGLEVFSGPQLGSLRILIAGIVMAPIAFKNRSLLTKESTKWMFLSGLLGYFLPSLCFGIAGKSLSSSLSGTLNSSTPIFVLLIGILFFGTKFKKEQSLGLAIALFGSLFLVFSKEQNADSFLSGLQASFSGIGVKLALLATVFYGVNVNIVGKYLKNIPPLAFTAFTLTLMIPLCLAVGLFDNVQTTVDHPGFYKALFYVFILGAVNSAFMSFLFNKLVQLTSPVVASSVTYLIPLVATIAGFLDHEVIGWAQLSGMAIVLVGVFLINKK